MSGKAIISMLLLLVCTSQAHYYQVPYSQQLSHYHGRTHVFGGRLAEDKFVCSMAYIRLGGSYCSGVVIDSYHVMTAAHCVYEKRVSDVTVYIGDRVRGTSAPVPLQGVYFLRAYNGNVARGYDIAVLKLAQAQPSACAIYPQYFSAVDPRDGDVAIAAGYGTVHASGRDTPDLKQGELHIAENGRTVQGNPECTAQGSGSGSSSNQIICAVSPGYPSTHSAATCGGDSGGPLIKSFGGVDWVVGVNSYSQTACSSLGNVDKFARVYANHDAIQNLVYFGNEGEWTKLT